MKNNFLLVLAGGIGSRIWPYSRQNKPKQFQDILGIGKSFLQMTVERFSDVVPSERVYILTNENYKTLIMQELPELKENQILLEPCMRNTAPCIAYATWKIHQLNSDANVIIAPSDHFISRKYRFEAIVKEALDLAVDKKSIVTLGMTPHRPNTGYGYIEIDEEKPNGTAFAVKKFTEKPDLKTAIQFINAGNYLWNAGLFIASTQALKDSFEKFTPSLAVIFDTIEKDLNTDKEQETINVHYPDCEDISIDFGIMEKSEDILCIPAEIGWSDVGTWGSLYEMSEKNQEGNVIHGNALTFDTKNCLIKLPDDKLAIVEGLSNYIVAQNDNALMICPLESEQRVKEYLKTLKEKKETPFI
ncbi:mannose-1-phosphate guanylyltransferase [Aureibacter tunicatorum]|uniref:mannose-1-phosphate guanylyltransferase n=1 Tax=Aureibacter tunicatorum TaxID=866807 RepID=A0AAE4BTU9_9BACT|nr:sugar phosphate nucleotidyltransferase [Aureibacter tunicatorum]MDR6240163.1 mannose-1-phosphate guanylyltransferase [Aureibacter tunicatorum]BDD05956.1 mannose-1-phosphate guanylyltransferase [Aureibacter tunicatorum]